MRTVEIAFLFSGNRLLKRSRCANIADEKLCIWEETLKGNGQKNRYKYAK